MSNKDIPYFTPFYPILQHLHNTFFNGSVETLLWRCLWTNYSGSEFNFKRCHLAAANPGILKEGKGGVPGSRDPVKFGALDANSSKTVKGTNFKFGMHALRKSRHDPWKNVEQRAWL